MRAEGSDTPRTVTRYVVGLSLVILCFWAPWLARGRVPVPVGQQTWMLPWAGAQWPDKGAEQWDAFWWDGVAQFYPWRLQLHRGLQAGEWPLWDSQQFCGYPLVANGQSAMFYPLNWLHGLVHPRIGMGLSALLHFLLAALLTFGFCREIELSPAAAMYAALAFTLGGFMIGMVPLPTLVNSIAWLPGGLWGVERVVRGKRLQGMVLLAICVGMAFLAGHLQIALYMWLATAVYALVRWAGAMRRREKPGLGYLLAGAALGVLLALPQLLPSLELAEHSPRGHAEATVEGFRFSASWGLEPVELVRLLWPEALGSRANHNYAAISYGERCGYVGLLTLILALCALLLGRRPGRWGFAAAAGVLLWAAMGGLPAAVLYYCVPKQALGAGFVRLLSVYTLCIAVLGGMGLDAVRRRARDAGREDILRLVTVAAVALLCVDLMPWGWRTIPSGPAARLYPETQLTRHLEASTSAGERMLAVTRRSSWAQCLARRPRAVLPPNAGTAYDKLESVQGYDSLYPLNSRSFATMVEETKDPSPPSNGNMLLLENIDSPLLDLAGVRHVLVDAAEGGHEDAVEIEGVRVIEKPRAFPRAFFVHEPSLPEPESGQSDYERSRAVLTALARLDPATLAAPEFRAPRIANTARLQVPARADGATLVVTHTYYPGWRAYSEGDPVPVRGMGGVFQCLRLAPGPRAKLLMAYVPGGVHVGLFAFCLACGTLALLLVFDSLSRRHGRV